MIHIARPERIKLIVDKNGHIMDAVRASTGYVVAVEIEKFDPEVHRERMDLRLKG